MSKIITRGYFPYTMWLVDDIETYVLYYRRYGFKLWKKTENGKYWVRKKNVGPYAHKES